MKSQLMGKTLGLVAVLIHLVLAVPATPSTPAARTLNTTIRSAAPDTNAFDIESSSTLEHTFNAIMSIPDEILLDSDDATNSWLVANGYRPHSGPSTRDLILSPIDDAFAQERRANWWTIAKCSASLVSLVATTAVPAAKLLRIKKAIEELGGVKDTAKLLVGATKFSEWTAASKKVLLGLALEITGVGAVYTDCPFIASLIKDLKKQLGEL